MAVNKSKLPKPKAVSEVIITKDAFMALIRKYKNTSVAAAALVLALTSFMGISAFKVYSTGRAHTEGVKGVQSMNYHKDTSKQLADTDTSPAFDQNSQGATAAGATSTYPQEVQAPGNSAFSNGSPNATLPSQPNTPQFRHGNNCTFVQGVSDNKVCAPSPLAN